MAGGDHVRSFKMDPQVFAGSKPEQRAKDARDGSLAHFVYTRDGDNGGLIYWLGTRRYVPYSSDKTRGKCDSYK